jgi:alkylhydroperoxidase family enzyme
MEGKATIEYALRRHAVPLDEVARRHSAVVGLVRRMLGVTPHCDGLLEIWPPAFTTYNVLVPNLLDIPRCDLGLGLPPHVRALVTYVASRTYGCSYCAAHAALVGTVVRGPGGTLHLNEEAMNAAESPLFGAPERAAVAFAAQVARIPAQVGREGCQDLARHFDEEAVEAIVLAVSLMGFLNRFMNTMGVVLEYRALKTAEEHLARSGWTPGVAYDPQHDAATVNADPHDEKPPGLFKVAGFLPGAIAYDRRALAGIAGSRAALVEQLRKALGFVPSYLLRLHRLAPQRAFAHVLVERLAVDGKGLPAGIKAAMGYVAARRARSVTLAAHFAYLARRAGIPADRLVQLAHPEASGLAANEAAALALAHAASLAPSRVTPRIIDALVKSLEPPSIVEAVLVLSCVTLLVRLVAALPTMAHEPEIEEMLRADEATLDLASMAAG